MKANPGKFQAIAVGKRTHSENICFNLGENSVDCEDSVKLLGVTIDFKLDFDEHISNVCNILIPIYTVHLAFLKVNTKFENTGSNRS